MLVELSVVGNVITAVMGIVSGRYCGHCGERVQVTLCYAG